MSSIHIDTDSIRKIFSEAANPLPEGMDEATFNSVRDYLLNHLESKATEAKATEAKAAEKKAIKTMRGPSALFIFIGEKRGEVYNANPNISVKELSSKIREMWRALTPEVKASYKKKSAQIKANLFT